MGGQIIPPRDYLPRVYEGIREAGGPAGKTYEAKVVLTIDGLDLEHVVTGEIGGKS